ncbi:O-antigen ligase family protein [Sulfurospirillum sp. MES]|uniref:O-antigen ligase family protein n=1 Tax=Sulfurospirillum sp. MES TaxID=1565314 RepID=UPI0005432FB2|nr:O-antigen ligase family protein [Sulfurospirillum sp. MES]KHG33809.1 MAG: hypothetical protein OA34_08260 [Sulfurospirillum sp. MES]
MTLDRSKILEYLLYLLSVTFFFGKIYQVVAVLMLILFLYDVIRTKRWSVFNDTIFQILSAWCGYLALSALWAINPASTLKGVLTLLTWCGVYLAIRTILTTQAQIHAFVRFQVYVILFVVLNGLLQFAVGYNLFGTPLQASRITDLLSNDRVFSYIFPFWIGLFGALLALKGQSPKTYLLYATALIGILVLLPLSGSRGPLIIMAIFLPLIAWMSPYRKWAFGVLAALIIASGGIIAATPQLWDRMQTLKNPFEDQKHTRVAIWKTAFEEFKDNPVLGVGFKNFREREFEYYQDTFESHEINPEQGSRALHTHSPWMDILSEQGLVGIVFALTLLFTIAKKAYRHGAVTIIGSMGVWYAFSLLNSSFVLSSGRWSFFMILSIAFFAIIDNYRQEEATKR